MSRLSGPNNTILEHWLLLLVWSIVEVSDLKAIQLALGWNAHGCNISMLRGIHTNCSSGGPVCLTQLHGLLIGKRALSIFDETVDWHCYNIINLSTSNKSNVTIIREYLSFQLILIVLQEENPTWYIGIFGISLLNIDILD